MISPCFRRHYRFASLAVPGLYGSGRAEGHVFPDTSPGLCRMTVLHAY